MSMRSHVKLVLKLGGSFILRKHILIFRASCPPCILKLSRKIERGKKKHEEIDKVNVININPLESG